MSDRKQYFVALNDYLRDKKIEAIKAYRRIFHEGLYEAKCAIDEMIPNGKSMLLTEDEMNALLVEGFKVFGRKRRSVQVYRPDDGKKINAIKDIRMCLGIGLKEAKDLMDEMWGYNRPVEI